MTYSAWLLLTFFTVCLHSIHLSQSKHSLVFNLPRCSNTWRRHPSPRPRPYDKPTSKHLSSHLSKHLLSVHRHLLLHHHRRRHLPSCQKRRLKRKLRRFRSHPRFVGLWWRHGYGRSYYLICYARWGVGNLMNLMSVPLFFDTIASCSWSFYWFLYSKHSKTCGFQYIFPIF